MDAARSSGRRVLVEAAAVVWLAALAAAFLAPALSHGSAIGPYDLLRLLGLTATANAHVHNAAGSDEIQEFIAWQDLAWRQVHSGALPLWNPYGLLGMPLGLNFESAPFSLTVALGYAFPLALAHTATVAARLLLAGTGAYVLCRVLRLGVLPSVMGATIFELCGAFTIWLGAYEAGVYCFAGWILAASVLLVRGRRRAVPVALLAVSLALAFAAGEPQVDALLVAFLAVFALVVVVARRDGSGGRILLDHLLALLAACGLVSPLYLPAGQLLLGSARSSGPYVSALQPQDLTHLLFASYSGVPTNFDTIIGLNDSYVSMVYVGAVALVLALAGFAWLRRRPEVLALGVLTVLLLVILFAPPVVSVMRHLPDLKVFRLDLATPLLDFALAVLAAFGAEALVGQSRGGPSAPDVRRAADRLFVFGTGIAALTLAALGTLLAVGAGSLNATQANVRASSFLWPSIGVAACILFAAARAVRPRHLGRAAAVMGGRPGMCVLIAVEAAFCVIGGAWFLSSTPRPLPVSPAIAKLQHLVGDRLVGIGSCTENAFADLGIMPNVNADYGIDELIAYDPIMPTTYYSSYGRLAHVPKTPLVPHVFCPAVTSVRVARFYGVSFVLEPSGAPGPAGTTRVALLRGEGLYEVPRSGRATLVPLADATSERAATSGAARVQRSSQSIAGTWHVRVDATRRSLLVLRVTAVPGWQATIDGRPLTLRRVDTVLLAAVVPPGHHVVELRYSPRLLSDGLVVAALTAAALLAGLAWAAWTRRRGRPGDVGGEGRPEAANATDGAVTATWA